MLDRLLIIADDFTGALDTGIQFTKMGIRARIVSGCPYDFSKLDPAYTLLVVNTDSRHLPAQEAYDRVYRLASDARRAGFTHVYKKTDSGLRGNVGPELKAVLDAWGEGSLCFVPALPRLHRITRDGVAYIDGVPVAESVFGKDPFEPVTKSAVADIIRDKADVAVTNVPLGTQELPAVDKGVLLFDAGSDEDLAAIGRQLASLGRTTLCAGCAGFAAAYEYMIDLGKGHMHSMQESDGLLALCGSVNQITVDQLEYAGGHGFTRSNLSSAQKLDPAYLDSAEGRKFLDELVANVSATDRYVLDTLDCPGQEGAMAWARAHGLTGEDVRIRISHALGVIAREMVQRGLNYTLSLTGGDTLMGFMHEIGCTELVPLREIGAGAVLSALRWNGRRIQVISKSGGFGEKDIFVQMADVVLSYKDSNK